MSSAKMKKYDLHIHTHYSRCSNLKPERVLRIAMKRGLDGIAITDHNTISGALEAKRLNKERGFEVIIGEEINTDQGHVLGYYLKKEVKPGNYNRVVTEIKKQGGIAAIAHPFDIIRKSGEIRGVQAVEAFNGRVIMPFANALAMRFAKKNRLAITGGSDSHFAFEIGKVTSCFAGTLRGAIEGRSVKVRGSHLRIPLAKPEVITLSLINRINHLKH